ncbi:MAG: L-threonylcarbamoyladenylate synthase [Clostridiales bacterium]|nr:L-threonylcarbamoyladenylate synthase [Clostridiales bacterium]
MSEEKTFHILSLDEAKVALLGGGLVLYPTETLYGLGCDAMNPDAVAAVFWVKRRSLNQPLPVIIGSMSMLDQLVYVTDYARQLMDIFWPGPLTIVLPARKEVPDILTGRLRRVAVRFSSHPAACELSTAIGRPLVASSANISGVPAVARKEDLDPALASGVAGVYASGPESAGGPPSTLVDTFESSDGGGIRILRLGAVTKEDLIEAGFTII